MDKDMLDIADFAFTPKHGELYLKYNYKKDNLYLVSEGIFAADEIIDKVKEIFKKEE